LYLISACVQASPSLCASHLARLLPPLTAATCRAGAPGPLLAAALPCLELLVRHSPKDGAEAGRLVSAATPGHASYTIGFPKHM
jgi:hypothetical protein